MQGNLQMNMLKNRRCTAFADTRQIASGDLIDVARATKRFMEVDPSLTILIFDDNSELVEIDFRGTQNEVVDRIQEQQANLLAAPSKDDSEDSATVAAKSSSEKQGPGRPKLGVVSKEVTLLPRHWEWLAAQPGGASVTLRKLIDAARKQDDVPSRERKTQEITYKFMSAMAGNEVNFEEATRALFAGESKRFAELIEPWPQDLRSHIQRLLSTAYGA
jgi:hypothetical protein